MSSDKPTSAATNPRRTIHWLVVGHLVVGLIGACVTYSAGEYPTLLQMEFMRSGSFRFVAYYAGEYPTFPGAVFLGILFSQASLLGIWGGLGSCPWWQRVIGVVLGVGYVFLLLGVTIAERGNQTLFVVSLATGFMATPLLVVRFFDVAVDRVPFPAAAVNRRQFSVRDLMILTLVIACLIAIGKRVPPNAVHRSVLFWLLLIAATFGVIGVFPVWFILAGKRPVLHSVGLVAVGACAGYCLARSADVGNEVLWLAVTAAETVAVVVSLLFVRSCGYRLVRLPPRRHKGVEKGNQTCQATTTWTPSGSSGHGN